jgi:hypothetical protein
LLSNQTGFEANVFAPQKHLPRKQYRLPTEAEWEYAARGGVMILVQITACVVILIVEIVLNMLHQ